MPRHRPLHPGYERLIGAAAVDPILNRSLLRDPRGTALRFGIATHEAELVADIRAGDLKTFATALLPILYGRTATGVPHRSAVAG